MLVVYYHEDIYSWLIRPKVHPGSVLPSNVVFTSGGAIKSENFVSDLKLLSIKVAERRWLNQPLSRPMVSKILNISALTTASVFRILTSVTFIGHQRPNFTQLTQHLHE